MSDASENLEFWGRQLLRKSEMHSLRNAMRTYVSDNPPGGDLEDLRARISGGTPLSALVDEEREERF